VKCCNWCGFGCGFGVIAKHGPTFLARVIRVGRFGVPETSDAARLMVEMPVSL
jgi:hypothetical protein